MIFVDTCYLIALMNDKAKKHNEALTLLGLIENESTLINSTVLVEMLNNLNKKRYEAKRQDIIDLLYGMDNIHYLSEQDYNDSFKLWEQYDHSVNFSDCTITHTMQKHGVQNILSFDGDFDKINGINRIYL